MGVEEPRTRKEVIRGPENSVCGEDSEEPPWGAGRGVWRARGHLQGRRREPGLCGRGVLAPRVSALGAMGVLPQRPWGDQACLNLSRWGMFQNSSMGAASGLGASRNEIKQPESV